MSTGALPTWQAFQLFIEMGGHGPYVWTVYLTALALLVANYMKFRRDRRRTIRTLSAGTLKKTK